jgi:uncharacterized protein (TIGR03000 family)
MGYGGWGGYVWGGAPVISSYAYSPMIGNAGLPIAGNYSTPTTLGFGNLGNAGTSQSFYFNAGAAAANEATIIVHLPADATLTVDGEATQSRSNTRIFHSPPLEPGKTYTYELCAEINRDGRALKTKKTVDVQAGRSTEVTMNVDNANRTDGRNTGAAAINPENNPEDQIVPAQPPRNRSGTLPRPPRDQ